jgi:transcriptional regulator with XRE-family HTH domain
MTIGERISIHRKEMNLSQEALGEKLGVSRQAVYKWESDLSLPDSNNLIELSKIFNISLNELLGKEESKPRVDSKPKSKNVMTIQMISIIVLGLTTIIQSFTINRLGNRVENLNNDLAFLSNQINVYQNYRPNYPIYDEQENLIDIVAKEINFEKNTMLVEAEVQLKVEPNDVEVYVLFGKTRMDLIKNDSGYYVGTIELNISHEISAKLAVKSADKTTYSDYLNESFLYKHLLIVESNHFDTYLQTKGDEITIGLLFTLMNYDRVSYLEPFFIGFPENNTVKDIAMVTRDKETGKEVNRREIREEIIGRKAITTKIDKNLLDVNDVYELTFEYLLNDKVIVQQLVGVIEYKDIEFIITPVQTTEYNFIIK